MKSLILLSAVIMPLVIFAANKNNDWLTIPVNNPGGIMESVSKKEFKLTVIPDTKSRGLQIVRTLDTVFPAKSTLSFRVRFSGCETMNMHLILSCRGADNKVLTCWGPKIKLTPGTEFKEYKFPLITTFGFEDKEYNLRQFKPSFKPEQMKAGEKAVVELRDFEIKADAVTK